MIKLSCLQNCLWGTLLQHCAFKCLFHKPIKFNVFCCLLVNINYTVSINEGDWVYFMSCLHTQKEIHNLIMIHPMNHTFVLSFLQHHVLFFAQFYIVLLCLCNLDIFEPCVGQTSLLKKTFLQIKMSLSDLVRLYFNVRKLVQKI